MPEPGDFNLLAHFNVKIGANTPSKTAIPTEPTRPRGASEGFVQSTKILKLRQDAPPSPAVKDQRKEDRQRRSRALSGVTEELKARASAGPAERAAPPQNQQPAGGTMISRTPQPLRGDAGYSAPECDLCINDKLIKQKAARLRHEKEEDAAYARHAADMEAAHQHSVRQQREAIARQKQDIARAADEARQRRLLREAAEREEERRAWTQNASPMTPGGGADFDQTARSTEQRAYAADLARQIREKQARLAAEKQNDFTSVDTASVLRNNDPGNHTFWNHRKEQYRRELENQIRQRNARLAADREADIVSEQQRLASQRVSAGMAKHDADVRAARRQQLLSEWDRAIQFKRDRNAAIQAEERAQERVVMEQAAATARREQQVYAQAKFERQQKIANFLRDQVRIRRERQDAERDRTPDFTNPVGHVHDNYLSCGSCNRKMPVNRFGQIRYPALSKDRPRWR